MYRRPSRVYINHFFLKASFACYLVPIIIAAITVSVAGPKRLAERNQTLENHTFYSNNRQVKPILGFSVSLQAKNWFSSFLSQAAVFWSKN